MDVIVHIALVFFLIQFLVILTVMVVALLRAQPEVPLLDWETTQQALKQSLAAIVGLPPRGFWLAVRLARFLRMRLRPPLSPAWNEKGPSLEGLHSPEPR
jgi:hypothetical protein